MASVCFYFQIHQPFRLKPYQIFHIGRDHQYFGFDEGPTSNKKIVEKVSKNCYLPTTELLLELLNENPEFKFSFSISGIAIEQLEQFSPAVIANLKLMAKTGRVEFLAETYYHSLAWLYSLPEFESQVRMHHNKMVELFGVVPTAFRNTELIYENRLAQAVEKLGYKVVLAEGADHILGWRSPNYIYNPISTKNLKLLMKNYRLSDDIAFRFSDRSWSGWPLTAERYAEWLSAVNGNGYVVNLFMDFETFGEHHGHETGIFDFIRHLPKEILKRKDMDFVTVVEAADRYPASDLVDVPYPISWADEKRSLSAWTDNAMQRSALKAIFAVEEEILKVGEPQLTDDWRKLQSSDHFYYMSTSTLESGEVHAHFSPYDSPYSAFTNYMNVIHDINYRIKKVLDLPTTNYA